MSEQEMEEKMEEMDKDPLLQEEYDVEGDEDDDEEEEEEEPVIPQSIKFENFIDTFYPYPQPHPQNAVDLMLGRNDYTLEELLDVDEFLSDLKRGKPKLLDALSQPEMMMRMVNYIASVPTVGEDGEKYKKFAHFAYEAIQTEALSDVMILSP